MATKKKETKRPTMWQSMKTEVYAMYIHITTKLYLRAKHIRFSNIFNSIRDVIYLGRKAFTSLLVFLILFTCMLIVNATGNPDHALLFVSVSMILYLVVVLYLFVSLVFGGMVNDTKYIDFGLTKAMMRAFFANVIMLLSTVLMFVIVDSNKSLLDASTYVIYTKSIYEYINIFDAGMTFIWVSIIVRTLLVLHYCYLRAKIKSYDKITFSIQKP